MTKTKKIITRHMKYSDGETIIDGWRCPEEDDGY